MKSVPVCETVGAQPPDRFSVGSIDLVSSEGNRIYLLHISTPSSASNVVFRNVLMWAHFHFGGGLFFPRSRPKAHASSFGCSYF